MKSWIITGLAAVSAMSSGCAPVSKLLPVNEGFCPPIRAALPFAGTGAVSCGFGHFEDSLKQRIALARCVAKARELGHPVAFGYIASTPDSFICGLGILRADNRNWSIEYSVDYSFPANDPRRGPSMFVGRCSSIAITQAESEDRKPFATSQCVADEAAFGYFRKYLFP